jgi:hypothetical protein
MKLVDVVTKALQNRSQDGIVTCNVAGIEKCCDTLHNPAWQVANNSGKVYLDRYERSQST